MFRSILYPADIPAVSGEPPAYFHDLNLDRIVSAATSNYQKYHLEPLYDTSLHDAGTIRYRQEIMRELENPAVSKQMHAFAGRIFDICGDLEIIRENLSQPGSDACNYLEKGRLLDAAQNYCDSIAALARFLSSADLHSRGLRNFREYLADYAASGPFLPLQSETSGLKSELSQIQYCMLIKGNTVRVRKYEGEPDHTAEIERIFAKFKQGDAQSCRRQMAEAPYAPHVEAGVLNLLAGIYPGTFAGLDRYCARHIDFMDATVALFSEEIPFYFSYLEYIEKFKQSGLHFCYPEIAEDKKDVHDLDGFDLALAEKQLSSQSPLVCNDFYLNGEERIIVVSGPNQGGKTTFARTFGQLHHLACIGCCVPGRNARLLLFDRIFTHFEREEDMASLSGRLQDDLVRMRGILGHATANSIIIINEILSSTALEDAVSIGKNLFAEIDRLDALCVCVTFLDELASFSPKCVSMVSAVVPEDPARRTFKILRNPADGLAYAMYIARKYGLTYDALKGRIRK